MSKKKLFRCSVSWRMIGGCDVEAASIEEAREIIEGRPLAAFNGDDLYGSFEVEELEEVKDE